MSHWSLEKDDGTVETLTLAQLEERVRNGDVPGNARVSRGGSWARVAEIPYLRRHLRNEPTPLRPAARPSTAATATSSALILHENPPEPTVLVRRDAQGKPLPPDPKHVDLLLLSMSERPRADRMRNAAKWLWALAAVLLVIEAIAFGNLLLQSAGR